MKTKRKLSLRATVFILLAVLIATGLIFTISWQNWRREYGPHGPVRFVRDVMGYKLNLFTPPESIPPREPYKFTDEEFARLDAARARIPEVRMGRVKLTLLDKNSNPLSSQWHASYRLIRHEFNFGMLEFPQPEIERLRQALMTNQCTVSLNWRGIDPDPNQPYDTRLVDLFFAVPWLKAVGYRTVYHTIFWNIHMKKDGTRVENHIPDHIWKIKDKAGQRAAMLNYARKMADYTKGQYDTVVLWNEPTNYWANCFDWSLEEILDFMKEAAREFKSINTESEILINIGNALWAKSLCTPYELCSWIVENDIPIDSIGLQLYYNGYFPWGSPTSTATLSDFADAFEKYATFNIPIEITELAVPSKGAPFDGWNWTEERQADFIEAIYTITFSIPQFKSITYFSSVDAFMLDSGLLTADLQPREAWYRLVDLIDSWTTKGEENLDDIGQFEIHGFGGDYIIEATEKQSGHKLTYRTNIKAREEMTQTLSPGDNITPLPSHFKNLAPMMTTDNLLPATLTPISEDGLSTNSFDFIAMAIPQTIMHRFDLTEIAPGIFVNTWPGGFFVTDIPEGAATFECELKLTNPTNSHIKYVQVFVDERRFLLENPPAGAYNLTIPLRTHDESIAVHVWWKHQSDTINTGKYTIRNAAFYAD